MTAIEWTDETWNPIVGCSVVSPGCTNCYAMKTAAARLDGNPATPHYAGTTKQTNGGAVWTGRVMLAPDHILEKPLRWKSPRRIFVNSMGDLFHWAVPDEWIDRVFAVMALAPQHTFQVLTKRAHRMRAYMVAMRGVGTLHERPWPLPNVWLGVSAEDQARADERIPELLATPAAVHFVSAEPLLGPIDFTDISPNGIQQINALSGHSRTPDTDAFARLGWIIVGGESGPGARPMHPDWARAIRDQCAAAGTAFFFKQWGEWRTGEGRSGFSVGVKLNGGKNFKTVSWDNDKHAVFVGKSRAGRLLDGRLHDAFPERTS